VKPYKTITKLVLIVKPYKTRSNLQLVFTKLVQMVKPYNTRSNLSVYKASANRETIQNQEQSFYISVYKASANREVIQNQEQSFYICVYKVRTTCEAIKTLINHKTWQGKPYKTHDYLSSGFMWLHRLHQVCKY